MNGSKQYGTSGDERTPRELPMRLAPRASPFSSPRPSPSGRGRIVRRLSITSTREFDQRILAKHPSAACCSLSLRERVRVRGNGIFLSLRLWTIPGTVELRTIMGENLRVPRRFFGARVCDPQQLRPPPSPAIIPTHRLLPTRCGSQSRAPLVAALPRCESSGKAGGFLGR
jgi:hypothetical protein